MALGDDYITLSELKSYMGLEDVSDNAELSDAIDFACRTVEAHCHRQFNKAGVATARVFRPLGVRSCLVDDFHTTSGLVIETSSSADGVFDTTWTSDQYELRPLNGVRLGRPGWPYWEIEAVDGDTFPQARRATVRVTADWGWASVPEPVRQACLIIASENYQLRKQRLGIAGSDQFGQIVRLRDNGIAARKLTPFCRSRILVA
jgi:hypothetical protein